MIDTQLDSLTSYVNSFTQRTTDWHDNLEPRKKAEAAFHDNLLANKPNAGIRARKRIYSTTEKSCTYIKQWLKCNSKNLVFLDYACGPGSLASQAAQYGAQLALGIDVSQDQIRLATSRARETNMKNIYFCVDDCEQSNIPSESIDRIVCMGVLHHMKIDKAYQELFRILKPGGKILAVEPLNYNPVIKCYRNLTPKARTHWEASHILTIKDILLAKKYFTIDKLNYWHMTSPAAMFFLKALPVLNMIDTMLTKIPYLQLWSWQCSLELSKPLATTVIPSSPTSPN